MKPEEAKYFTLCLWFAKNQYSKKFTTDQFEAVLNEIGKAEDKLRELGTNEEQIQEHINKVAKAYSLKKTEWDPRI